MNHKIPRFIKDFIRDTGIGFLLAFLVAGLCMIALTLWSNHAHATDPTDWHNNALSQQLGNEFRQTQCEENGNHWYSHPTPHCGEPPITAEQQRYAQHYTKQLQEQRNGNPH